jgi:glycosyltransferase involved in cell wall biosynthesis
MEVWAHTLVKNEARWLWYSVSSVINYVDKLLLWDTGSTDRSIEIEKELGRRYPGKIILKQRKQETTEDFTNVRQEMLDETKSDWFIIADGDEIWFEDSMRKVIETINKDGKNIESIIVSTINLVGDIFHFQEKSAGRYKFGDRVGHYNLRAVNRSIPGLHSQGVHGVWGWADSGNKMIQDRESNKVKFVDAPYLHATNLMRSSSDKEVIKRGKKYRFELGEDFPKDFYYPEVFFRDRPNNISSAWNVMSDSFKFRAFFETPLRKLKRRIWKGKAGY